jgi:hypothetical protein
MSVFDCFGTSFPSCADCDEAELNRIIHFAFVKKGTDIDLTDPAATETDLLAAELACNAIIIRNINGTYDGGAVQVGKGHGKEPEHVVGMGHTITYTDFNMSKAQIAFYNSLKKNARQFDGYPMTQTKVWPIKQTSLSVAPKLPITDDNKTSIEGEITVKWNLPDLPLPYDVDTDAFDTCQELNLTASPTTYVLATGTYSIPVTTTGGSIDFNSTASGTLTFAKASGTLPTGTTLNAATGVLSGTPSAAGTYNFVITVTNECNLVGTLAVTVVVTA